MRSSYDVSCEFEPNGSPYLVGRWLPPGPKDLAAPQSLDLRAIENTLRIHSVKVLDRAIFPAGTFLASIARCCMNRMSEERSWLCSVGLCGAQLLVRRNKCAKERS